MILFPKADDIEYNYENKTVSFTMIFFNTDDQYKLNVTFSADNGLQKIIEELLHKDEDEDTNV